MKPVASPKLQGIGLGHKANGHRSPVVKDDVLVPEWGGSSNSFKLMPDEMMVASEKVTPEYCVVSDVLSGKPPEVQKSMMSARPEGPRDLIQRRAGSKQQRIFAKSSLLGNTALNHRVQRWIRKAQRCARGAQISSGKVDVSSGGPMTDPLPLRAAEPQHLKEIAAPTSGISKAGSPEPGKERRHAGASAGRQ